MDASAHQDLLRDALGGDWTAVPTQLGAMGSSFLATNGERRLFVKWPADTRVIPRLAQIGVVPPLVASGEWQGTPFLIQEWIEGESPDRAWLRSHAPEVVRLMRTYHADRSLRDALLPTCPESFAAHLTRELRGIEADLRATDAPEFREPPVQHAIERLVARARTLSPGPLVATHGDPNLTNFLIAPAGSTWSIGTPSPSPTPCAISPSSSGGTCPRRNGPPLWPPTTADRIRSNPGPSSGGPPAPPSASPSGWTPIATTPAWSARSWPISSPPNPVPRIRRCPPSRNCWSGDGPLTPQPPSPRCTKEGREGGVRRP